MYGFATTLYDFQRSHTSSFSGFPAILHRDLRQHVFGRKLRFYQVTLLFECVFAMFGCFLLHLFQFLDFVAFLFTLEDDAALLFLEEGGFLDFAGFYELSARFEWASRLIGRKPGECENQNSKAFQPKIYNFVGVSHINILDCGRIEQ